jgi:hypothetical protein
LSNPGFMACLNLFNTPFIPCANILNSLPHY